VSALHPHEGLKVYGYTRGSTDEQELTLRDQPVKIRALAESLRLDLLDVVEDAGESSKTLDRPGIQFILRQLDQGNAGGIVVAKLDRLTRHIGSMCHLLEEYFGYDRPHHLFSAEGTVDARSARGRVMVYVMTSFDQGIREQIVENTLDAMKGKRRRSERMGNLRFGEKVDGSDARRSKSGRPVALVPCVEDLVVVERIVMLRETGMTHREIAYELNALGIPSKRGVTKRSTGRWSHSSVGEILRRAGSGQ
jgi:site-specific DNA recombinase